MKHIVAFDPELKDILVISFIHTKIMYITHKFDETTIIEALFINFSFLDNTLLTRMAFNRNYGSNFKIENSFQEFFKTLKK